MKYTKIELIKIINNIRREIENNVELQEKIIYNSSLDERELMREVFNLY
jgi:hypothetical protein